jgi:hypothetical protein
MSPLNLKRLGSNFGFRYKGYGSLQPMSRTNLFFKVEVEHDADENPQRIGAEIARHLKRMYGVIDVDLSNVTTEEE